MPDRIATLQNVHAEAEILLPWYATGRLDAAEAAFVEAHLSGCPDCQRQLMFDRRMIRDVGTFNPEVDAGWQRLREHIDVGSRPSSLLARTGPDLHRLVRRPAVALAIAAQLAFVIIGGAVALSLNHPSYRALGSDSAPSAANLIVMFRPDARETEMRAALQASSATLVGGPTAANAYLLHVPANERPVALTKLRADRGIALVQPIDGSAR